MLSLDRKLRNLPGEFAGYLSRLSIRVRAVFASFILFFLCDLQTVAMQCLGAGEKTFAEFSLYIIIAKHIV